MAACSTKKVQERENIMEEDESMDENEEIFSYCSSAESVEEPEISESGENGEVERDLRLDSQLATFVRAFDDLALGDNLELFKRHVAKYVKSTYFAFKPSSDPMKIMLNVGFNASAAFVSESQLWLKKIGTRQAAKPSIKHPFQSQITRDMPDELFFTLWKAVQHTTRKSITDNSIFGQNKKGRVMSLTSKVAVIELFAMLNGLDTTSVRQKLEKTLSGRRKGKASMVVDTVKDFAFTYMVKQSKLLISFHYGVWNKSGFPMHHQSNQGFSHVSKLFVTQLISVSELELLSSKD